MRIVELPLDAIDIGERLRAVDPAYANVLAGSIALHGQLTPIDVRSAVDGRHQLMAGAHRIQALLIAGKATVRAVVHEVDDLKAQLIEVDENLMRHELTALDRAAFLQRRKAIYLQLFPKTGHGGKRGKEQEKLEFLLPQTFAKNVAERLKMTPQWVNALISIHDRLTPAARRALSGTKLANNAKLLLAIAALDADRQGPVVEEMTTAQSPAPTLQAALKRLYDYDDPKAVAPADARYRRFVADWTVGAEAYQDQVVLFMRRQGYKITSPRGAA